MLMEPVARYIFEAGMLKRVKRSGWWSESVGNPESVADHSFRAAVIAFMLARMEGCDDESANRICTAAVFHDMHETRLLDLNKITARYIRVDEGLERKVERDQIEGFEPRLKDAMLGTLRISEREGIILKDADYLECAFQAREYAAIGHKGAENWVKSIGERLRTASAKKLHAQMRRMEPKSWWKGLKRL
jgi:putative hydrolase of HD superfamily